MARIKRSCLGPVEETFGDAFSNQGLIGTGFFVGLATILVTTAVLVPGSRTLPWLTGQAERHIPGAASCG